MAFDPGIRHTFPDLRTSEGGYVNTSGLVFYPGIRFTFPDLRTTEGGYVNTSGQVFYPGKKHTFPDLRTSGIFIPTAPAVIYYGTHHLIFTILPQSPGDTTVHLALGRVIDFYGSPRWGRAPLSVAFVSQCTGAILRYTWNFGDGYYGYDSDPAHIYRRPGVYTVSLSVKIGTLWYSVAKVRYITVTPGGLIVSRTNRLIRHAITPDQGVGFYSMPDTMPMPESNGGAVSVFNSDNQLLGLVLDAETGRWFDVTTRVANGLTRYNTDKNGAEFSRYVLFPEDTGTEEKDFLRMLIAFLYFRPLDEDNRGDSGYDANGYPTGMEIQADFYADGEPTTPGATLKNIPLNGELKIDRKLEGHRVQLKVTTNRGDHFLVNRLINYIASKRAAAPALRISSEMTYQASLADCSFWLSALSGNALNRCTGNQVIPGDFNPTFVAGPSAVSGIGMQFTGAKTVGTLPASGTRAVLFWAKNAISVSVNGAAFSVAAVAGYAIDDWQLYYGAAAAMTAGAIVLNAGAGSSICDFRIVNAELSADEQEYYFTDVRDNSGGIVLPS